MAAIDTIVASNTKEHSSDTNAADTEKNTKFLHTEFQDEGWGWGWGWETDNTKASRLFIDYGSMALHVYRPIAECSAIDRPCHCHMKG